MIRRIWTRGGRGESAEGSWRGGNLTSVIPSTYGALTGPSLGRRGAVRQPQTPNARRRRMSGQVRRGFRASPQVRR